MLKVRGFLIWCVSDAIRLFRFLKKVVSKGMGIVERAMQYANFRSQKVGKRAKKVLVDSLYELAEKLQGLFASG